MSRQSGDMIKASRTLDHQHYPIDKAELQPTYLPTNPHSVSRTSALPPDNAVQFPNQPSGIYTPAHGTLWRLLQTFSNDLNLGSTAVEIERSMLAGKGDGSPEGLAKSAPTEYSLMVY